MIKLTVSELEELFFEEDFNKRGVTFTKVEEGKWIHGHKSQYKEVIFTDGKKHYSGTIGRSGDDSSDWTYDSEIVGEDSPADIVEVEKVEAITYEWVEVK